MKKERSLVKTRMNSDLYDLIDKEIERIDKEVEALTEERLILIRTKKRIFIEAIEC